MFSAVIFDLNGTVVDDEEIYGKAFNKVLSSLGIDTKKDMPHEKGIGVKENWVRFLDNYAIKTNKTPDALAHETQEAYLSELDKVSMRSGFDELAQRLRQGNIQIALATSNTWEHADKILNTLNLREVFDAVTTGDEVVFNKPDPEIFTITADKLGVDREQCLVIEDSASGVEAAKRAKMKVVAITRDDDLRALSKADLIIEGFSELTLDALDQLWNN